MKTLQLAGQVPGIELDSHAIAQRDKAIDRATAIIEVEDELDLHDAVEALKSLKYIAKAAEDSRVAIKAPFLQINREIDSLAKSYVAPAQTEIDRINPLIATFERKRREEAAEAERKRQAELRRLELERVEAEQAELKRKAAAERAAEDARRKAEAEFLAEGKAEQEKAAREAAEAQRKAKEESDRIERERQQAAAEEAARLKAVATKPKAAPKIAGISFRDDWDYRVVNMAELYAARPDLCRIEDRRADILKVLKAGGTVPGIEAWKVSGVSVRG